MSATLTPVPSEEHWQFILDLGGPIVIARRMDDHFGIDGKPRTGQSVSNWKSRGIPFFVRGLLVIMANEKEIPAPANFFNTEPNSK